MAKLPGSPATAFGLYPRSALGGLRCYRARLPNGKRAQGGSFHRKLKRKVWDSNPHDPSQVARFSKPARQALSGYLPYHVMDPLGIEPRSPACRAGVFPLDDEPEVVLQWTGWESNPPHRLCKSQSPPRNMPAQCCVCLLNDPGWIRTITLLHVTQASSPLDHGIDASVPSISRKSCKPWNRTRRPNV